MHTFFSSFSAPGRRSPFSRQTGGNGLFVALSLLCSSLLSQTPLHGEAQNPSTQAWISHRGDLVTVDINGKETSFPLSALNDGSAQFSVKLGKHESVFLRIKDPNTLLFAYTLGKRTETETAEYKALQDFAKGLKTLFAPASAQAEKLTASILLVPAEDVSTGISEIEVGGIRLPVGNSIETSMRNLAELFERIDKILTQSVATRTPTDVAALDRDFEREWAAIEAQSTKIVEFLFAIELTALRPSPIRITYVAKNGKFSSELITGGLPEIGSWNPNDPGAPERLAKQKQILAGLYGARHRVKDLHDRVAEFAPALKVFRTAAANGITVGEVKGDITKNISQEITITKVNAGGGGDVVKNHQTSHTGTLTAVVSPRHWIHFRPGVGAVYSFVKNPEFSANEQSDSSFLISQKTNDYNELGAAVTGNFVPDRYWEEAFEPFIQLGYVQADDAKGVLLGLGLRAYEKLNLAAGIIYQEARQLEGGQTVGGTLKDAAELNVGTKFKSGLYLQVGIDF